ncbi:enoyl-[acyl-carrier protein] reductase I [Pseudochelatococcus lubricantis]|uniref:Enoyl-[acyl-carrier-protein] reductase [NADH] n=1 Tax=Pseudochelatococcus lubricantis TaxID=1538102 RepID=A0ABX0UZ11_9HYPH|nr:enoyl-ACP reductase FabI [Pseudochelatococcus lubricantis]NIJ58196.1 enoyl-[acyl-carrier protein] reductase I [Pseudochelatococcus lubricantis]
MIDLSNKRALVVGVANEHSIAWGIARALHEAGAEVAMTYLNEKAKPYVQPLAESIGAPIFLPLDVRNEEEADALFQHITEEWGTLDTLVHSIAFAPMKDLHGRVVDASLEGIGLSIDISVHSFIRLLKRSEPLMKNGGSAMTMSFYGAEKVVEHYNLMGPVKAALEATSRELASELGPKGITVNTLSPGPMLTRAASGIGDFDDLMKVAVERSPMRRLATIDDVGAIAAFLASDLARNITGETIHIDAGYHIMG